MRAVVQRVSKASVSIEGVETAKIGAGLLVYLAVRPEDTQKDIGYMIRKITGLRIFEDNEGKMNLSALDINAPILVVSQFTLYGDARHGRRPSYIKAGLPEEAEKIYDRFVEAIISEPLTVKTGQFQADMQVESVNDGPVTILLDSEKIF